MKSYIYLASPYSHVDPQVMHNRYLAALDTTAVLLRKGLPVFSPIVHCHNMAMAYNLPRDHEFWLDYDTRLLRQSSLMLILCIDGWEDSVGIKMERDLAKGFGIPEALYVPHN